jgi:hypothetical protein
MLACRSAARLRQSSRLSGEEAETVKRALATNVTNAYRPAVGAAYVAAALFVVAFTRFFVLPPEGWGNVLVALLGVAPHLLLFPVVAMLPAPRWARAAGYGWLVVDVATDIMALNGVPVSTYLPMRYGGHVSAALWIAVASWHTRGASRSIGLLLALDLGGYSFVAPFDPTHFTGLLPSFVLLPVWLVLVGRLLPREDEHRHMSVEGGEPAPLASG